MAFHYGAAKGDKERTVEETVFRVSHLPEGTDWVSHPDLNVVELSDSLDCTGKIRALSEISRRWRHNHLSVVETA